MDSVWLSYIPHYIAEEILQHPDLSPVSREQRFDSVALFADISGFTAISEAFAKVGKVGAEELTQIINGYFEPAIALIQSYGGIVGRFGGDAITVIFPYQTETQMVTSQRAVQCALDMQTQMRLYKAIPTSLGEFTLEMKIGVGMGTILSTTLGDTATQLGHCIDGSALNLCIEAEHRAKRGEIVVHQALLEHLPAAVVDERRGEFASISDLCQPVDYWPLKSPNVATVPDSAVKIFAAYLHPVIARRLMEGQAGFINEHRKVTVIFLNFEGFDYEDDPGVTPRLQAYLVQVIAIVQRYGGFLSWIDMGDKGSKCILLFGTPLAHENDEERALRCALEIMRIETVPSRIGVATGFVYCGEIGSPLRREYTVMGDSVNLAARLMQAATSGQILVSDLTQRCVAEDFIWEHLSHIRVKGKSDAISVHRLINVQERSGVDLNEPAYHLPMIGRYRELKFALEKIDQALQGRGQILAIVGEAGTGKSRLTAEVVKLALEKNITGYGGECESFGINMSYLVWRDIWRGLFGLHPGWSPAQQIEHLKIALAQVDANLPQRMPLLDAVLNLPIPDNDLTESLDGKVRKELRSSMLLEYLRHQARKSPLLLILEDCHWIDPLSRELLEFIGRNISDLPVLVVIVCRPAMAGSDDPLRGLREFAHFGETQLIDFTPDETQQLIELKLGKLFGIEAKNLQGLVNLVAAKAEGNPFYIEEILNFIHDRGINPQDTLALNALELPDSLHSLIMSRIDQLDEVQQVTLKVASVIGRFFRASWIWGSYPQAGTPAEVRQHLEHLSRLDIVPLYKPEPELEYLFKHITTQEVTYKSMAVAMRKNLHEAVAAFVERTYPDELDQYIEVLAYHFDATDNQDKKRFYFRRAGDMAKAIYANEAAIDYYQRLLRLPDGAERVEIMLALGEIWHLVGLWKDAKDIYHAALELAETSGDEYGVARCQSALGYVFTDTESPDDALPWLEAAKTRFEMLADWDGLSLVLGHISRAYLRQGNYEAALTHAEQQLYLATEHQDQIAIVDASANIAWIAAEQGERNLALEYLSKALELASDINYQQGVIDVCNDLAGTYMEQGNYAEALEYCRQGLEIALQIGYQQSATAIISNAGEIYRLVGDYNNALDCYGQALQMYLELGDWTGILFSLGNIDVLYTVQRRYSEAEEINSLAVHLARKLNLQSNLCEYLYNRGYIETQQQRYAQAQAFVQEGLEIALQIGNREFHLNALLLLSHLKAKLNVNTVQETVDDFQKMLADWQEDSQQAAIHYEIWKLAPQYQTSQTAAADLYKILYTATPNIEYLQRHYTLTGNTLPKRLRLPALLDTPLPPSNVEELLNFVRNQIMYVE